MSSSLRIGRIAYANVIPLYAAFDAGAVEPPGQFITGSPAELNALFDAGHIDIGPVSVAHYVRRHAVDFVFGTPYERLPSICIASHAAVRSVLLVSDLPPAVLDGRSIAATRESASGSALLEVILRGRYGVRATFHAVNDPVSEALKGRPTMLIGDRALDVAQAVPPQNVYDLGKLWHDWTASDMVYAVWAARRQFDEDGNAQAAIGAEDRANVVDAFRAAYAWSLAHPDEIVDRAIAMFPRPRAVYNDYYRTLRYDLDTSAEHGLALFAAKLLSLPTDSEADNVSR